MMEHQEELERRKSKLLEGVALKGDPLWFTSPGRAEIIGNHTDHNCGKVIVSAISCNILAAVYPVDGYVRIVSDGYRPIVVGLNDLEPHKGERGQSIALVRGVLAFLKNRVDLRGFVAFTTSNIFHGAGVSSSAAFSVLIAEIENVLACGGKLSPLEKAQAAQYAENLYFGKPCGLMDQCGVAFGGFFEIDFEHPSAPKIEPLPMLEGYALVLTNTGGSHSSLTAHYAAIRREMGDVASYFGKDALREVERRQVIDALPALRKRVSERAILRSLHFLEENERVGKAAEALKTGNKSRFLEQIRRSGESSYALLQNCFIPGSAIQPLALALKLSAEILKDGAFRMMGGGFTGAVLAFVKEGKKNAYIRGMARVFGKENVFETTAVEHGAMQLPG